MSHRPRIAKSCVCCGSEDLSKRPAVLMPFVANRVFGWEPVEITAEWNLRDLKCGMAYPVCNTLRCNDCGLIFLDIRFDDTETEALYRDYRGEEYTTLRERFEPGYRARNETLAAGYDYIAQVERFLSDRVGVVNSVLDWGGDTGHNTPFRQQATTHHVYDISGVDVVDGARRVEAAEAVGTAYDLVVLSQVLEHVPFPQDVVEQVVRVLRPGAALWVEVPDEAVIREAAAPREAYLEKRHWHEHINFFTEAAVARLLEGAGLLVVEQTTFPVTVGSTTTHVRGAFCRCGHAPVDS